MIKCAEWFNLHLTVKDKNGCTGYKLAQDNRQTDIVNLIDREMPSIAVR